MNGVLKRELYSLLAWHMHRTDHCPADTLARLVYKSSGIKIAHGHIAVCEKALMLSDLLSVRRAEHAQDTPKNEEAPLILFKHKKLYLVDGQNRINRWAQRGTQGPFRCLIVSGKK